METAEFETDDLLKLLTEALRRGPGSPEWHEAIEQLRSSGAAEADDYRLLMTVRERLESGQTYRQVRAGPDFTRELFQKIDEVSASPARTPRVAIIVALVSLILLVGSGAVLLVSLLSNGSNRDPAVELLAQRLFITPLNQWSFDSSLPADLEPIESLKLETAGGLRAAKSDKPGIAGADARDRLKLSGGICVESQIRFKPGGSTKVSLVIGHEPGTLKTTSGFVVTLRNEGFDIASADQKTHVARALSWGVYTLRIKLDEQVAIVEVDGQSIWTGRHAIQSPAALGVRLERSVNGHDENRVLSLRALEP